MSSLETAYIVRQLEKVLSPSGGLDWLKGQSCLDAGCGLGIYAAALAFLGAGSVVGVDKNEGSMKLARSKWIQLGGVEFVVASIEHLPFTTSSFDLVLCLRVLHHMFNASHALTELHRVLKVDGILCGVDAQI